MGSWDLCVGVHIYIYISICLRICVCICACVSVYCICVLRYGSSSVCWCVFVCVTFATYKHAVTRPVPSSDAASGVENTQATKHLNAILWCSIIARVLPMRTIDMRLSRITDSPITTYPARLVVACNATASAPRHRFPSTCSVQYSTVQWLSLNVLQSEYNNIPTRGSVP